MPDPSKEKALKAYNSIETWVEAEGKRLNEHLIVYDSKERRHRNCLYTPLDEDLTIKLAVRSKGPVVSDLAFEIFFDGRPIHPIYIKRGNHHVVEISHFFKTDDGTPHKYPFHVGMIERSDDAMLPRLSEEIGEIRIDVYKAKLVKSGRGNGNLSERTELDTLKAHETEIPPNPCCIEPSPGEPCTKEEMRSVYRAAEPYKSAGVKPLITFVYEYHERMDDAGGEDTKGGITAALQKRTRAVANETVVDELKSEVAVMSKELKSVQGLLKDLVERDKRRSKRRKGADGAEIIELDDDDDDEDDDSLAGPRRSPTHTAGSPLSSVGGGGSSPARQRSPSWHPRPHVRYIKGEPR